ncbi:MAG: RcnB family protein [Terracidiphilus sp.]
MRPVCSFFAASTLALALAGGSIAIAQDHHDDQNQQNHDQYVKHSDWKKGHRLQHADWDRAQRVDDWRAHHLHQPPAGYEWRRVDGQYVCANNDGVIFRITVGN